MTESAPAASDIHRPAGAVALAAHAPLALLALAAAWFYTSGPLGPDVSWLITVTERMLDGRVLYEDILEPNPPMAGLIYMLPVVLARLLRVAPEPLVIGYTLTLALLSTGLAAHLVTQHGLVRRAALFWPIALLLVGVAWGEDFAQREHFATLAMLPLLGIVAMRASGGTPDRRLVLVAGLCGGFVLAVKPHFALAILLCALYAAARRRSLGLVLAPEMWIAGGVLALFTAVTFLVFPGFARNILPVAATVYIPARADFGQLLAIPTARGYEALLVIGLLGIRQLWRAPMPGAMFAASIGFALAFLVQGRGYDYQMMPALTLGGAAVFLAFADSGRSDTRGLDTVLALGAALALAAVPMAADIAAWRSRTPLMTAVGAYGTGLRIANMGPDLTATSPLHRVVRGELVNSAPGLLMTLSAKRLERRGVADAEWLARIHSVEDGERTRLLEDFRARPPDIIVTTTDGFDWIAWARENPGLAAILDGYEDRGTVPFDTYELRLLVRAGLSVARPVD